MDYEAAIAELERTIEQLSQDRVDLAESVRLYERGLALARRCTELLRDVQDRLRALAPPTGPASSSP